MSGQVPAITQGPSVLPNVRAETRPGGIALVRAAGGDLSGVLAGVGVIFMVVGGIIGVVHYLLGMWSWLVGAAAMLVGLGCLGSLGWTLFRRATLGEAELLFPRMPLRLGEPMTVRFSQRRLRGRAPVQGITASIKCREWVRYRQGTDTRTATHDLWEAELPQQVSDPLGAAEVLRASWQLRLPPELPPSFSASDNAIRWTLTIRVDVAGRPDIRNEFVLPVVPEVVRALR